MGSRPASVREKPEVEFTKAGVLEALAAPRELWRAVLWESLDAVEADRGSLLLLDNRRQLRLRAVCELERSIANQPRALFDRARRSGRRCVIPDVAEYRRQHPGTDLPRTDAHSIAVLPIRGPIETQGVVYLERRGPRPFSESKLERLEERLAGLAETLELWSHSADIREATERARRLTRTLRELLQVAHRPSFETQIGLESAARWITIALQAFGARLWLRSADQLVSGGWCQPAQLRRAWRTAAIPTTAKVDEPEWIETTEADRDPRFAELVNVARSGSIVLRTARRWRGPVGSEPRGRPVSATLEIAWATPRELASDEEAFLEDAGATWLPSFLPGFNASREHQVQQRHRALLEGSGWLVARVDRLTGACHCNTTMQECTGYSSHQLTREGWTRLAFAAGARRRHIERLCSDPVVQNRWSLIPVETRQSDRIAIQWRVMSIGEDDPTREIYVIGRRLDDELAWLCRIEDTRSPVSKRLERSDASRSTSSHQETEELGEIVNEVLEELAPWIERPEIESTGDLFPVSNGPELREAFGRVLDKTLGRWSAEPPSIRLSTLRREGEPLAVLELRGDRSLWESESADPIPQIEAHPGCAPRGRLEGDQVCLTWELPIAVAETTAGESGPDVEEWCLVLDSDSLVRDVLGELFALAGSEARTAASAHAATQLIETNGSPALALVEARSPTEEATRELITELRVSLTYVVTMSGDPILGREEAQALGADGFLAKPFDGRAIERLLSQSRATRPESLCEGGPKTEA